ncbi:unnamed protein product, partial [Ectocarpus sp. 4 AP-2014]
STRPLGHHTDEVLQVFTNREIQTYIGRFGLENLEVVTPKAVDRSVRSCGTNARCSPCFVCPAVLVPIFPDVCMCERACRCPICQNLAMNVMVCAPPTPTPTPTPSPTMTKTMVMMVSPY